MDTRAEALDYDAMDHREVNRIFVDDLLAAGPGKGSVLDVGTGNALIPIELCRRRPAARVWAIDASREMLAVSRRNVERAGLAGRIRLEQADAKRLPYGDAQFGAVISNGALHHVPTAGEALAEAWRVAAPGGLIFIRDLVRPGDGDALRRLVDTYVAGANRHQRQMFQDSLRAALTLAEVRTLAATLGAAADTVRATSDRHWTWAVRKR